MCFVHKSVPHDTKTAHFGVTGHILCAKHTLIFRVYLTHIATLHIRTAVPLWTTQIYLIVGFIKHVGWEL